MVLALPQVASEGQEDAGHLVGLFLTCHNLPGGWWGEGDDMIFIDGETWPPSYHGTGTEEIFGGGACPNREYAGPCTGFIAIQEAAEARIRRRDSRAPDIAFAFQARSGALARLVEEVERAAEPASGAGSEHPVPALKSG